MTTLTPENQAKRSFIYHQQSAASYEEVGDALLMAEIEPDESANPASCSLIDLSNLARTGLRGPATEQVLAETGLPFPAKANQCESLPGGETIARLGKTECWVLGSLKPDNTLIQVLEDKSAAAECYPLYCQDSHAWFVITGGNLPQIMAKLCAVDLRPEYFPPGSVAQTSVARVNAILISHSFAGQEVFSVLSDSASAGYLWGAILDAMDEFGGKATGIRSLKP